MLEPERLEDLVLQDVDVLPAGRPLEDEAGAHEAEVGVSEALVGRAPEPTVVCGRLGEGGGGPGLPVSERSKGSPPVWPSKSRMVVPGATPGRPTGASMSRTPRSAKRRATTVVKVFVMLATAKRVVGDTPASRRSAMPEVAVVSRPVPSMMATDAPSMPTSATTVSSTDSSHWAAGGAGWEAQAREPEDHEGPLVA